MMNRRQKIIAVSVGVLSVLGVSSSAHAQISNPLWKLSAASLTPSLSSWTLTIPALGGSGVRCLQTDNTGLVSKASAACGSGSGGGGSGGSWATTTSNVPGQLINYPLNNTDIVTIGSQSTTTARFYFDPNTLTAVIQGLLTLPRISATSTVASSILYASTTALTVATAADIPRLSNLASAGFVKTSSNGTLSVDTNTYLTGNQTITLTGDVTGSGSTAITTAIDTTLARIYTGQQTFKSASSTSLSVLDGISIGRTASTTLVGDNGTSTFLKFVSLTSASTTATSTTAGINLPYGGCVAVLGLCLTSNAGTVTSVATNAGLTGGTITTSGTIGLDTSAIVNGLLLQYNGSRLAATGTQALTAGYYIATTTTASQLPYASTTALSATQLCLTGDLPCRTTWPSSGSGVWPFTTSDTNYAVAVQSTTTPEWFKNGMMASTTSYFVNASTTALTAQSICFTSDICRTTWPTGGGSGFWPFTTTDTNYAVAVQSTTTPEWFKNGMMASTTSYFLNASTTAITAQSANILRLDNLTSAGFVKSSAIGTLSVDTSTYLTSAVTAVTGTNPIISSGGNTPNITFAWTYPWTPVAGGNATSSVLYINGGIYSNAASSTINDLAINYASTTELTLLGQLYDANNSNGTAGNILMSRGGTLGPTWVASTTFSTGLTYSAGAVTVNTSQNIATLSNLTTNGFITTSGGVGTLGVQAFPVTIAQGGTNNTAQITGTALWYDGTKIAATSSTLTSGNYIATTTLASQLPYASTTAITSTGSAYFATLGQNVGIGTTTPFWTMQVASNTPYFALTDSDASSGNKHGIMSFLDGTWNFGTSSDTNTGTSTKETFAVTGMSHQYASTTAPTVSSGAVDGTDSGGAVYGCSSACTITFAQPYSRAPACIVTAYTGSVVNSFSYTVSATVITVTETGLGTFAYMCRGR